LATNWSAVKMPPCHAPMLPFVWIWYNMMNMFESFAHTSRYILHHTTWTCLKHLFKPQESSRYISHHTTSILFHHIIIWIGLHISSYI
jgi:hypothetical protein